MATTPYPFVANTVLTASQLNSTFNIPVSTKTSSYTLVAADAGTRVVMNSASATTITVNTSLFAAGDNLQILNIGAGVCTVTAGTATVSTSGTLALVANAGGTLYFTSAGVSVFQATGVTATAGGLVCVKAETAFSAVASFTADSVFTSAYTNYKIMLRYTTSTSTNDVYMQLRVGGVAAATNYAYQYIQGNSTTVTAAYASAQTSGYVGLVTNGDYPATVAMELFSPFVATNTGYQVHNQITYSGFTSSYIKDTYGVHSTGTAYDGLAMSVATGTMTGTYTIYGYAKTV